MSSLDAITRLRAIAARLLEREDPDAAWFVGVIRTYEAGDVPIDVVFGLRTTGYRTGAARKQRDDILAEMGRRFHADEPSDRQRALKIRARIRQFAAGARQWRPGTVEELCHYVLKVCPAPSTRTIERALGGAPNLRALGAPSRVSLAHEELQTRTDAVL
jgi:hypothetical protein